MSMALVQTAMLKQQLVSNVHLANLAQTEGLADIHINSARPFQLVLLAGSFCMTTRKGHMQVVCLCSAHYLSQHETKRQCS